MVFVLITRLFCVINVLFGEQFDVSHVVTENAQFIAVMLSYDVS